MSSRTVYLHEYQAPAFLVDTIDLDIDIRDGFTRVIAISKLRRNPGSGSGPLVLHGDELELETLMVDGRALSPQEYVWTPEDKQLVVHGVPESFELKTIQKIQPDENTKLMGLYRSKNGYVTQCEPEGFRRITFFPDRPDVMARYTCTLHADKAKYPVLLANGNPAGHGDEEGGRHWAKWEDPFAKPSYLFACVAAKLDVLNGSHQTASGRKVDCRIYVEPGKVDQCHHAMAALKKSMAWDEAVFGLEMDLDQFMIVAVDDFTMGAMENKGLNIFNTKYVLARPETATDMDFQNIDRVVAHEYFHNWTGDRVTCRDWFQLSLKEGLTVFRDQQFGMDVHSKSVTRIQEVRTLRAAQFPEDAGPMAHPIRPASYQEINNFYTATVYEKGAEVIRMIYTLLGKEAFRSGMDLYFQRHDGQAVTCEDFLAAMQDASGVDLTQFQRWYNQAGCPRLEVQGDYDASAKRFTLTVTQHYPETAYEERMKRENLPQKRGPLHLPLVMGLLDSAGKEIPLRLAGEIAAQGQAQGTERILQVRADQETFVFEDVKERPVPSLLRGFSAPVSLGYPYTEDELTHLMAFDTDAFNRWEAGQRLATIILLRGIDALKRDPQCEPHWIPEGYIQALCHLLQGKDPALTAEAMILPLEKVLAEQMDVVDPDAIHLARLTLRRHIAKRLRDQLLQVYRALEVKVPYAPEGPQVGSRALRNACIAYLAELNDAETRALLLSHYEGAANMTDSMAALSAIANQDMPQRQQVLEDFYTRWKQEPLVVDKWLMAQSTSRLPGTLETVRSLMASEAFDIKNPNKVYALIRAFCQGNPLHFHAADGSGYRFAADAILLLDAINPQVASGVARAFDRWRKFDAGRQANAKEQLQRIQAKQGLSGDVAEVVGKALEG